MSSGGFLLLDNSSNSKTNQRRALFITGKWLLKKTVVPKKEMLEMLMESITGLDLDPDTDLDRILIKLPIRILIIIQSTVMNFEEKNL
jgi:hypothetical protein